jgi:hypothetical protein
MNILMLHKNKYFTRSQDVSLDIFALLLVVDIVYTSIGVLSGNFIELNPNLNQFIAFPAIFIGILIATHVVYFFAVVLIACLIAIKKQNEMGTNKYTNLLLSMVCYVPCAIMMCAMVWILSLNLVSLGIL